MNRNKNNKRSAQFGRPIHNLAMDIRHKRIGRGDLVRLSDWFKSFSEMTEFIGPDNIGTVVRTDPYGWDYLVLFCHTKRRGGIFAFDDRSLVKISR